MKEGYLPKEERKKIMFLCDDIRMHSGIATMAREIVLGTAHVFNWVNIGAAVNHPEVGKRIDLSQDSGNRLNISIGNIGPIPDVLIVPTGQQLNVATNPVSVITWNPIPPGVNQVWVPIDPLNP